MSAVDGVYVGLPLLLGGFDSVEIRGSNAWWNAHLPDAPDDVGRWTPAAERPPTRGRINLDPMAGELQFTWDDNSSLEATYAIIDGSLWLGVLHRSPDDHRIWRSRLIRHSGSVKSTKPADARMAGEIIWDQNSDSMMVDAVLWSLGRGAMWGQYVPERSSGPYTIRGVKKLTFRNETNQERVLPFLEAGSDSVKPLWSDRALGPFLHAETQGQGSGVLTPLGMVGRHDQNVVAVLREVCQLDDRKQLAAESGRFSTRGCEVGSRARNALWIQTADSIAAPWSIRLGPIGMLPMRDAKGLVGSWATEYKESRSTGEHRLRVASAQQPLHAAILNPLSEPSCHQVPHSDHYRPNQRGIVFSPYAELCVRDSCPEPGYLLWFPLGAHRIWAYRLFVGYPGYQRSEQYILYREK